MASSGTPSFIANNAGSYYAQIQALTPAQSIDTRQQVVASPSGVSSYLVPFALFAPLFLFLALFISGVGLQLIHKARNFKNISTAILVAFLAASIPMIITVMERQSLYQAKAGPDETPKNIRIVPSVDFSVLVLWDTDAEKIGAVGYSVTPFSEGKRTVVVGDSGTRTQKHTVKLDHLQKGKGYEVEIFSGTTWYQDNGKSIHFLMNN